MAVNTSVALVTLTGTVMPITLARIGASLTSQGISDDVQFMVLEQPAAPVTWARLKAELSPTPAGILAPGTRFATTWGTAEPLTIEAIREALDIQEPDPDPDPEPPIDGGEDG